MKRLIKWTSFLILLLVAVVIAAPFFIPVETVKKLAGERVKAMTGRDLVIAGDVKASIWPNIGITLQKVTLSNPEGFSDEYMADIGDLTVGIALMPLLHGEVQIKQFTIIKPTIHLEINKQNIKNWQFHSKETNKKSDENISPAPAPSVKKTYAKFPFLGKIKIEDGDFTYRDTRTSKFYNAKNVNLEIKMPAPDSPVDIEAELTLNNERGNISLRVDQPLQLIEDGDSRIKTSVKIASLLSLQFEGKASRKNADGNIDLDIPSLIALSGFAGKTLDWKGDTSLAFNGQGMIACSISECDFSKARFMLDDNIFNGDMKINFAAAVPVIEAKLATEKLNLNPYLPKAGKQAALSIISSAQAAQGWDTKPINLSWLRSVNADLSLNIDELLYQAATLKKMALSLKIANGALALDIPHVELYAGTAKISANANAANSIAATFSADKLQIEPLLKDFAQFDRLAGVAVINASVTGNGTSQRDIISSLGGEGKFQINDGTIRGVDIAKVISRVQAIVAGADTSSEKTNFSELGGTFGIAQGIVKNNDLIMKALLLRLKGEGTVDLPNRYVNYRLTPSVVATLQGQGGKDKTGLDIPVMVEGNFESLKFTPDLGGVVQDAIKNPEKIKDTVKTIKDSVKKPEDIKNLLKGFR